MAIGSALALGLAAGATAAGGVYSANQQSKAAKRSAQVAQQAGDQNIAEQRRQYDQTRADQMPFMASDLARRAMADRSYGIQGTPNTYGQATVDMSRAGQPNYGAYVQNNPDLLAAFNASGGQYGGMDEFGDVHYRTHGQSEGRLLPSFEAPTNGFQSMQGQAGTEPFDPLKDFNASGDRAILNYKPIMDSTNAMFSAKGMGLDGSAMRAAQDRATDYTQNAFYKWRSGLEGSPTGAAGNIQQAGQNMVAANSNSRDNTANAMASSYGQRANANSSAAGSVLGAFNWYGKQRGWYGK